MTQTKKKDKFSKHGHHLNKITPNTKLPEIKTSAKVRTPVNEARLFGTPEHKKSAICPRACKHTNVYPREINKTVLYPNGTRPSTASTPVYHPPHKHKNHCTRNSLISPYEFTRGTVNTLVATYDIAQEKVYLKHKHAYDQEYDALMTQRTMCWTSSTYDIPGYDKTTTTLRILKDNFQKNLVIDIQKMQIRTFNLWELTRIFNRKHQMSNHSRNRKHLRKNTLSRADIPCAIEMRVTLNQPNPT
jgi:hypothetical protein